MNTNEFSKIPPELLSHILEQVTLLDPDAPLFLSLVCQYFRHAILTFPCIWRRLHITNVSEATDTKAVKKANLWFSRSGTCDMVVVLEGGEFDAQEEALQLLTRRGKTQMWVGNLELPRLIRKEAGRVSSLTLRFPMEAQVRYFLTSIYPAVEDGHLTSSSVDSDVLLSDVDSRRPVNQINILNIDVLSPPRPSPQSTPAPVDLAPLPHLAHMKLTNCTLSLLPFPTFAQLRSLAIIGPIRSQPLQLHELLQVLGATEQLRVLDLEARISVPTILSPASSMPLLVSTDDAQSRDLLLLPHLTHLILRSNHLLPILESFIIPSLHCLSVNDLDGNRPRAARETGEVLRRMLVRMEMPNAKLCYRKGLRDISISGVSFSPLLLADWAPVWKWCLHRMRSLKRAEVPWIVGDLMLSSDSGCVDGTEEGERRNELPCVHLKELLLPRCPPDILQRFSVLRPAVDVLIS